MATSIEKTQQFTSQAPIEGNISTEHVFTDRVVINMGSTNSFSGTIDILLAEVLEGCGRVDLCSITLVCKTTAASQYVKAGFCAAGSSCTLEQASMQENGINLTSNAYTYGHKETYKMIPTDTLSRQIRPVSSMLPTLQIKIEKSKDASVTMMIDIKVHGLRNRYISFPSTA